MREVNYYEKKKICFTNHCLTDDRANNELQYEEEVK